MSEGTRGYPISFNGVHQTYRLLAPRLLEAAAGVLKSGRYVLGEQVERFEAEFAAWCSAGSPVALWGVGVASGTDALQLALMALEIGPGDEVITAPNAGAPPVAAIVATGATPVLADVDPRTLCLDPAAVRAAITPRTRAIVPVHLYGRLAPVDELREVARRAGRGRRIALVEDACQAHGARRGARRAGSLGDAAAFSFYPTKNLGGYGDGGMVVTPDRALAERVRQLRSYGEHERHCSLRHGRNSRLDELQAALLRVKLPYLDQWNAIRRQHAARYRALLGGLPGLVVPDEGEPGEHVFHLYVVRCCDREGLRAALARRGVPCAIHYPRAVHDMPAYRGLARGLPLVEAERACAEVLSLPMHPLLTEEEIAAVAGAVAAWAGQGAGAR